MRILRYQNTSGQIGYAAEQPDGAAVKIRGDIFAEHSITRIRARVSSLLAPVAPPAVFCIGLNYRQHAIETHAKIPDVPVVFLKNPAAVQHPGAPIVRPTHLRSDELDYEGELAVVIGQPCKNVAKADALGYVLGYTCANDVSARDWQRRGGGQWCRGKTFDTFAPLGPCLVTPDEIPDPNALRIRTLVNGQVMQDANTSDMIFDVPTLIEFLSADTTLLPGTVILTGTPPGVGMARTPPVWLHAGDAVTIEIEKIGLLSNPVQDEP